LSCSYGVILQQVTLGYGKNMFMLATRLTANAACKVLMKVA